VSITAEKKPKAIDAKISDEDIARERAQIGISQYQFENSHAREATEDTIRHFAFGIMGDDNPLWHEPEYGATTRWRGQIAPPLFASCSGINETPPYATPEQKALFKGLYRGVGRYNVGTEWRLFRPIRPGDRLFHDLCVASVDVKAQSSFSGGRTVIDRIQQLYVNKDGEPVCVRWERFVNAERGGSNKTGKYAGVKRHVYTKDEIAAIDKIYAAEERRGATPRYWEDVNVGDQMVPVAKGPLSTMDVVCAHVGWGVNQFQGYGQGPLRFQYKTRQKLGAFYAEDEYGVPAPMISLHWDQDRAEDLGLPAPYDYGQMRSQWMAHAVCNWMGDDAWLSAIDTDIRKFNFHGDTTIITGQVTSKRSEGPHHIVELDVKGVNQRDEVNVSAHATIILPSRKDGPAILPTPPLELRQRGVQLMAEAAARVRAKNGA
jgi:acyl dehydratase